jgi:predicted neuraminidase
MKRTFLRTMVLVTSLVTVHPAWADQVYKCILASGEILFTSRPCAPVVTHDQQARTDQQSARLDEIEQEIAAVKFDLMEADMAYDEDYGTVADEDRERFDADYKERRAALTTSLRRLDRQRSALVGEMVSDLDVPVILMGQSN